MEILGIFSLALTKIFSLMYDLSYQVIGLKKIGWVWQRGEGGVLKEKLVGVTSTFSSNKP